MANIFFPRMLRTSYLLFILTNVLDAYHSLRTVISVMYMYSGSFEMTLYGHLSVIAFLSCPINISVFFGSIILPHKNFEQLVHFLLLDTNETRKI